MEASLSSGLVCVDAPGRERFHDSQGYGRPRGDALALAPVEAAHLLFRGDLSAVDGMDLLAFLATTDSVLEFVVYRDLRERGFYLSPARDGWVDEPDGVDLVVHPRGTGPWDGDVAHRLRVVGERQPVRAAELGAVDLAVVDEDGELTYFETSRHSPSGDVDDDPPSVDGDLLGDRVLVRDPPESLHDGLFYGQRLHGRNAEAGPLQLSLIEAAHLARQGGLALEDGSDPQAILERGADVEGDRFDRRLAAYTALRDAGLVPKSGFKFGTDFRAYETFESVESVGHSRYLARVVPSTHAFAPRDLSLDVRLATSVRKRALFALVDTDETVEWLSVDRLTP